MEKHNYTNNKVLKFDIVSLILSFMVIMIHASYTHFYPTTPYLDRIINDYYCDYISGFAVPGFFLLSGIKFYRNYDYSQTRRKLKSRVDSLIIPFIAWNLISVIWAAFLSYTPGVSSLVAVREKFVFSVSNVLGGVLWFKFIHPFWYMAMLIIFTLLCPVIYTFLRDKRVGLAIIVILFLVHAFCTFPETSWPMFQIETIVYSLCFYMIGGIIGRFYYDKITAPTTKLGLYIAIFEFVLAVAIRTLEIKALFIPSILLGIHGIWTITGALPDKVHWVYKTSFFIYPAHTFVLPVVNKLISFVLPKISVMALVNTVLGTIITFVSCIYLAKLVEKILPKGINSVLNGGRSIT